MRTILVTERNVFAIADSSCMVKPVRMRGVSLAVAAFALAIATAYGQSQTPVELTPPAGNVRFLAAHATGTQDYTCVASGNAQTASWAFYGPQATLTVPLFHGVQQQVVTHFLSPVPQVNLASLPACTLSMETSELNCPTWQSSFDSSAVWGERAASLVAGTDASCPNGGAIPCLLLKAVQTKPGEFGRGELAQTTYIQRLRTSGGAAPVGSCKAGDQALVPYSADYLFFKASQ